jgi:hypothetical protein
MGGFGDRVPRCLGRSRLPESSPSVSSDSSDEGDRNDYGDPAVRTAARGIEPPARPRGQADEPRRSFDHPWARAIAASRTHGAAGSRAGLRTCRCMCRGGTARAPCRHAAGCAPVWFKDGGQRAGAAGHAFRRSLPAHPGREAKEGDGRSRRDTCRWRVSGLRTRRQPTRTCGPRPSPRLPRRPVRSVLSRSPIDVRVLRNPVAPVARAGRRDRVRRVRRHPGQSSPLGGTGCERGVARTGCGRASCSRGDG